MVFGTNQRLIKKLPSFVVVFFGTPLFFGFVFVFLCVCGEGGGVVVTKTKAHSSAFY